MEALEWRAHAVDAKPQNLSQDLYDIIEKDAKSLAAEILLPYPQYIERFKYHQSQICPNLAEADYNQIRRITKAVSEDFDVSPQCAAVRASKLKLISSAIYKKSYPLMF